MLADHAHVGLFRIGVVEAIAEPVGHQIAEHQHVAFRGQIAAFRGWSAGIIFPGRLPLRRLLLERGEERRVVAAEPAETAFALRGCWRSGGPPDRRTAPRPAPRCRATGCPRARQRRYATTTASSASVTCASTATDESSKPVYTRIQAASGQPAAIKRGRRGSSSADWRRGERHRLRAAPAPR